MDLQTVVDGMIAGARAKTMETSLQLTLSELILKLEAVKNKDLPAVFNDGRYRPTGIGSWRGSYRELAISYEEDGAYEGYQGEVEEETQYGPIYKSVSTAFTKPPTAGEFLEKLKEVLGKTFTGYKGGDFYMGKNTPVWVANYGMASGFGGESEAIVEIVESPEVVVIKTEVTEF